MEPYCHYHLISSHNYHVSITDGRKLNSTKEVWHYIHTTFYEYLSVGSKDIGRETDTQN
jgi:hypothetical protein